MKSYVLTSGEYSDYRIHGVFSSRGAVADFLRKTRASITYRSNRYGNRYTVEEYEIDEMNAPEKFVECYGAKITIATGEMSTVSGKRFLMTGDREYHSEWVRGEKDSNRHIECTYYSPMSQDHADKLAVEARQHIVRIGRAA